MPAFNPAGFASITAPNADGPEGFWVALNHAPPELVDTESAAPETAPATMTVCEGGGLGPAGTENVTDAGAKLMMFATDTVNSTGTVTTLFGPAITTCPW